MQLAVLNENQGNTEQIDLSERIFNREFKEPLVHQVVTAYLSGGRSGTKAQKSRGQVRGGGKKPWRQKGTGGARAGTIRSPLWRGGGVIFAAVPRDFKQKVNKKMYRVAISAIFSELIRQKRLQIVNTFEVAQPKTKVLVNKLQNHQINDKMNCLIITEQLNDSLDLAARNIPYVSVCSVNRINPVMLIKHEKVIITKQAISNLNEALL